MVDANVHALARELARLRRHVRQLEVANKGPHMSVEEGAIDFYDDDGNLRLRSGKQKDGSWMHKLFQAGSDDVPPAPTEPDVQVISDGVVAVTWDGRFEERYSGPFRFVQVHLGETPTFTPGTPTFEGVICARRGGTVVVVTESDDDNPVYVRLVATSRIGSDGPPSTAVLVDEEDEDDLDDEDDGAVQFEQEGITVSAAGTQTLTLSYEPIQNSEHLYWNGLYQPSSEWSRDELTVTIPDPGGLLQIGDGLIMEYAHQDVGLLPIPLGSPGWRYLITEMDDAVDRSGVNFDDSGWPVGRGGFAGQGSGALPAGFNTYWPVQKGIWLRREVRVDHVADLVIAGPVDNHVKVYWNGALVGSKDVPGLGNQTYSFTVPAAQVQEINVLAVRGQDDTTYYGLTEGAVIDVSVAYA